MLAASMLLPSSTFITAEELRHTACEAIDVGPLQRGVAVEQARAVPQADVGVADRV